jgi:hypothetical protein
MFRRMGILLLAATVPFALVMVATGAASKYRSMTRTASPKGGERLSDYVTAAPREGRWLAAGVEIWRAPPNDPSYQDLEVIDGRIVVVNAAQVRILERSGSSVRADAFTGANGVMAGASVISPGVTRGEFWLYSPPTGYFGRYFVTSTDRPSHLTILDRFGGQPFVLDRTIALAGPFPAEQFRLYEERDPAPAPTAGADATAAPPAVRTELTGTVGQALVPGLQSLIAKWLNDGNAAVKPGRDRIVLAMQWHQRLHVYRTAPMTLERAIATPTVVQLEVATAGKDDGVRVPTMGDGTTFVYTDVVATDDAIIALYSGRERRKFGSAFNQGDTLHVYSWDGRLVGVWLMKDAMKALTIDERSRELFGLRSGGAASIVRIDASDVLREVVAFKLGDHAGAPRPVNGG